MTSANKSSVHYKNIKMSKKAIMRYAIKLQMLQTFFFGLVQEKVGDKYRARKEEFMWLDWLWSWRRFSLLAPAAVWPCWHFLVLMPHEEVWCHSKMRKTQDSFIVFCLKDKVHHSIHYLTNVTSKNCLNYCVLANENVLTVTQTCNYKGRSYRINYQLYKLSQNDQILLLL